MKEINLLPKKFPPLYRIKRGIIRTSGMILTSFVISLLVYNYQPIYEIMRKKEMPYEEKVLGATSFASVSQKAVPTVSAASEAESLGVDSSFSIVIPTLGAKSTIIPDIDPLNKEEYQKALRTGIAHAKSTARPGEGDSIYLFAHSTGSPLDLYNDNSIFYNLSDAKRGDEIIIFFNNQKYTYQITKLIIVNDTNTTWLEKRGYEELILQTCYPPHTTDKRLIVIAAPKL